jgi:hypothetical protein
MKISRAAIAATVALTFGVGTSASEVHVGHADMPPTVKVPTEAASGSSGPCKPDVGCVRLGKPSTTVLTTINDAGADCTVDYTVMWGDGTAPVLVAVPPNSNIEVSHTYAEVETFTVREKGAVLPTSDPVCKEIPGGWDRQFDIQVIPPLRATVTLNDIDNLPLRYLSTDAHPYFEGNTRINGTITITGAARDKLAFLFLEISQGDTDTFAILTDEASAKLVGVEFGADHAVKVSLDPSQQPLFELASAQAALFNNNLNGPVQFRLIGAAADFTPIDKSLGHTPRLVRYKRGNRYGPRDDETQGGDDWVLPSVRPVLVALSIAFPELLYGDISNMNGGEFPPEHNSHRKGIDVDVKFPGYEKLDASVAHELIRQLNNPHNGARIQSVLVTYNKPGGEIFPGRPTPDPFWLAIKNLTLNNGTPVPNVIIPWEKHLTHFHWRITP